MQVKRIRRSSAASIVRHELKSMIKSGYFKDGTIPSEEGIAAMFGVSRTTVRDALANLENLGYISRIQGRGTIINQVVSNLSCRISEGMPFTELIGNLGYNATVQGGKVEKIPAPADVAEELKTTDTELYRVTKIFTGDGKPAIYGMNYYSQEYINDDVFQFPMDETSIFHILQQNFNFPDIAFDVVDIQPVAASEEVSKALGLEVGTPILFFEAISMDKDNHPLMVNREYYNPNMIHFCERRVTQYY